jgi:UDP-glucose 4-epimerase
VIEGQRCIVTGGAGTIGSTIVDQLVEAGADEVIILDNFVRGRKENLEAALSSGRARIITGDIRDRRLLSDVMAGIDLVFHQAAIRITQCAEDPRLALEVLVDGTYEVVEAAADAGVRKVVAASSASVYGLAEDFPTSERHHPYANDTLYGAAKTFNEGLLRSFHAMRGLDYVALRYFNVYGPRMDVYGLYTEVLIRWMERIECGQAPLILGDGTQTMDFVFTEDIARANLLAASSEVTDEVFNIGSGAETSLTELAHALLRVMGSDLQLEFGPPRGVNAVTRRLADVSRSAECLGWKAETDLDEGLRLLVAWWRQQRQVVPRGVPSHRGRRRVGLPPGVTADDPCYAAMAGSGGGRGRRRSGILGMDCARPPGRRVRGRVRVSDWYLVCGGRILLHHSLAPGPR